MANLATLKAALNAAVYQNNQNAITGKALNTILTKIIDTLGAGYRYAGVATPSANPGTIDNRVFYLATAAGTYTNFGDAVLDGKALHIFIYDTTWHDVALDVPTTAALAVVAGTGADSVKGQSAGCTASGNGSTAIGFTELDGVVQATAEGAHAEGYGVDGDGIYATGIGSHAEGSASYGGGVTASGEASHAEGSGNLASGACSHAEGVGNEASADFSHAEGQSNLASGACSHAEGKANTTQNLAEHAEGCWNKSNKKTTGTAAQQAAGSTLSSVGCGTAETDRKNAIEVMQNGDVYIKNVGGYDGTNPGRGGVSLPGVIDRILLFCNTEESLEINWASCQPLIFDNYRGYLFVEVLEANRSISIFNDFLKAQVEGDLGIHADYASCLYVGIASATKFDDNGDIYSSAFCCVYENSGQHYLIIVEL